MSVDLDRLSDDQKITACIMARAIRAWLDHFLLNILSRTENTTELAMALKEPEQSLVRQQESSQMLEVLPRLSELLRQGKIDQRRLGAVYERVVNLPSPEMIAEVEAALVGVAPELTRTQLARRTTKLTAEVDPLGYEQRCQKATKDRKVEFVSLPDGMSRLTFILPAVEGRTIYELLRQDADHLPKDDRTTDQKRADVVMDRFLGTACERTVQVHVTVPIETMLGLTDDPGLLDGYGPIAADLARELAMEGPWRGLLLDEYRQATAMTTTTYRPTATLREMVKARSGGTCAAPGCTSPIQELDHHIPWPQGTTTATGMTGYCAHHHHAKHDPKYQVARDVDGTLRWTTPTGRTYTTRPHRY
jgi:hypothetical protein